MDQLPTKVVDVAPPKPPTEPDRALFRRNYQVVALLVFWFTINFLTSLFFEISGPNRPSGLLVYGSLGIIASEIVVIAFLLTMLPIRVWLRLVLVSILVGAGLASLMMGEVVFQRYDLREFVRLIPGLPIIILGFALPFAMAKYFLRWRLSLSWLEPPASSNLTVSGLMAATTLVAASVAILNFGSGKTRYENLTAPVVCMGLGFVLLVPLSLLLLRSRRRVLWVVLLSFAIFIGAVCVVQVIGLSGTMPGFWACGGMAFMIASFVFFYGAALIVLVNSGGRLILHGRDTVAANSESEL